MPVISKTSEHSPTVLVMRGTGLVSSSNTKRLEVDSSENIRELETQCKVLQDEVEQVTLLFLSYQTCLSFIKLLGI